MVDHLFVKRGLVGVIIFGIFVLTFLVLKSILIPITLGLLFAYVLRPLHLHIQRKIASKTVSVLIVILCVAAIVLIPLIYFTPVIVNQTFETYSSIQNVDFHKLFISLFGESAASTLADNLNNFVGQAFSAFLNQFTDFLVNLPSVLLQFAVFLFTFFFALRDSERLKKYVMSLSPFSANTELKFLKEFRGITNAIVFGQVVIGVVQGLALGVGLFFLGVPKALTLTFIACIVSMIPVLGSWIIWLPTGLFLLVVGDTFSGLFLLIYGALFVSSIDNLVRPYLLSRQSNLPISVSIIGTIGGLYFFGIMGLVFGPLVLAYALIIIEFYREGKLNELFKK